MLSLVLDAFTERPDEIGWHRYILLRAESESATASKPILIGSLGAFHWPSNPTEVELGYGILPEFRLHGYATEAAKAMVTWMEAIDPTITIIAHTYAEHIGSIRILDHCNFKREGPGVEPGTIRFVKQR